MDVVSNMSMAFFSWKFINFSLLFVLYTLYSFLPGKESLRKIVTSELVFMYLCKHVIVF